MRGRASLISQSTQFPSGAKVGKRKICKGIFGRRRGRGDRPEKKEEEETEEIGVREIERKLILAARDALKTLRFRLGFFTSFVFLLSCRVPGVRHGHDRQKLPCPCTWCGTLTHTQDHFLMAASWPSFLKIKLSFVWFLKLDLFIQCCCLGYCDGN